MQCSYNMQSVNFRIRVPAIALHFAFEGRKMYREADVPENFNDVIFIINGLITNAEAFPGVR